MSFLLARPSQRHEMADGSAADTSPYSTLSFPRGWEMSGWPVSSSTTCQVIETRPYQVSRSRAKRRRIIRYEGQSLKASESRAHIQRARDQYSSRRKPAFKIRLGLDATACHTVPFRWNNIEARRGIIACSGKVTEIYHVYRNKQISKHVGTHAAYCPAT